MTLSSFLIVTILSLVQRYKNVKVCDIFFSHVIFVCRGVHTATARAGQLRRAFMNTALQLERHKQKENACFKENCLDLQH